MIKKLLVSPFAVEDTGDPMGGDGLFIDLTDAALVARIVSSKLS